MNTVKKLTIILIILTVIAGVWGFGPYGLVGMPLFVLGCFSNSLGFSDTNTCTTDTAMNLSPLVVFFIVLSVILFMCFRRERIKHAWLYTIWIFWLSLIYLGLIGGSIFGGLGTY